MALCCRRCNIVKDNKTLLEFLISGGLSEVINDTSPEFLSAEPSQEIRIAVATEKCRGINNVVKLAKQAAFEFAKMRLTGEQWLLIPKKL